MSDKIVPGIEFLSVKFNIKPEDKIKVFRYNYGNTSPYVTECVWNFESKAAKDNNGMGIYGFTQKMDYFIERLFTGNLFGEVMIKRDQEEGVMRNRYQIEEGVMRSTFIIIELEVDKHHVLYEDGNEIAFSQCNIIGIVNREEYVIKNEPRYTKLFELYHKAMESPVMYANKFIAENQLQHSIEWGNVLTRQHNDNELRKLETLLEGNNRVVNIEAIKNFSILNARPSEIHGLSHWKRVESNAILLAENTKVSLSVVRSFAYLHDICREDDGSDPYHGFRVSQLMKKYRGSLLRGLTEDEFEMLNFACLHHTDMLKCDDETINTCWDADRLDLLRVGITPLPERMATEVGAYFANNLIENNIKIH